MTVIRVSHREELLRQARVARQAAVRRAREDVNAFCEFVLRDEYSGAPIVQAPMHVQWQRILDEEDQTLIWAHVEAGKTQQIGVGRTLFEMGKNPRMRWLILGNTRDGGKKISRLLRSYIENSDELHEVFPHMLPGEPWGENAFNLYGIRHAKDSTVTTSGVHGDFHGSRLDRVLADDILDWENTRTQSLRKDLILWWPMLVGRMTARGKIRVLGNAFHPEDLYHWLAKQPGWNAYRYPVHVNGVPRWPEQWPWERIEKKARELGPLEAQRQLMCVARDDSTARFPRQAIEIGLALGEGTQLCYALTVVPAGYKTYTGVDLGVQKKDKNDPSCLFSIAVDPFGCRNPLNIETGKWSGPEIVRRINDAHRRYQSIIMVENNAAQDYIRQFAVAGSAVPVQGFTTGAQKAHPEFGVESIATEMMNGKWKIPNVGGRCHPEVQAWLDEMLFYSPEAHTGDRLMASWFAREAAVKGNRVVGSVASLNINRR